MLPTDLAKAHKWLIILGFILASFLGKDTAIRVAEWIQAAALTVMPSA